MIAENTNPQAINETSNSEKRSLTLLITTASIVLISALFFAKAVSILRIALCVCPVAIALTLLQTSDQTYIQFTLWIWFIAPLVRRIIDQRFGFADQNLVLLAPVLVTTLSACCIKDIPHSNLTLRPFLLCIAAVTYGCMIGLLLNPSAEVLYGYLSWLSPILFGLFVYMRSSNYPELRAALQKTLLQCVAALGIYGIYQYISPPVWDVYWWQSLPFGLVAAFGRPTPYEIRVWSSMNAPQPFAAVMGMCLLLILSIRNKYMVPIAAIGLAAFSLTLVRTEWLGLAVGLIYLASRLKTVVLLLSIGPTQKIIEARIESFTHLGSDDSVSTRLAMYQHLTGDLIQNPYGHGVGNKEVYLGYSLDSGPLKMLFNFGVLGTLLYLAGTLAALCTLISSHDNTDIFALGCTAILLSAFAKFLSLSSFMNASGVLVWLAIGMGFLAKRWNLDSRSVSNAPVY
jgi:hypothetical protein